MNVKLEFVVKLPQGVIDTMGLNDQTCLCSWIEADELHVRVEDDPPEYGDAFDDGFDEGFDEGYDTGSEEGFNHGHAAGYDEGLTEGYERAIREMREKHLLRSPSREKERRS